MKDKLYRLVLWLKKPSNSLWLMPAAGGLFAVIFAFAAKSAAYLLPKDILPNINIDIITSLLDVLSNSMLAVSTFSLSIMVSAFSAASNSATPRATSLVMADDTTRLAISSFISAFIYAVTAKIALGLNYYTQNGRFLLFIATMLVLTYVIYMLIRWVHTLSGLGRMDNTIGKIHSAARNALTAWLADPQFGCTGEVPETEPDAQASAQSTGYISHIYFTGLNNIAQEAQLHIRLLARPGHFCSRGEAVANIWTQEALSTELLERIQDCIIIEKQRSYQQDPRFGLLVMSEVAQRALSPAVNDPGTALTVINNLTMLLTDTEAEPQDTAYPHLSIGSANYTDLIRQPFDPIARDGAGNCEIQIRLAKALGAIAAVRSELRPACEKQARRALQYAQNLPIASDRDSLERLIAQIFPATDAE